MQNSSKVWLTETQKAWICTLVPHFQQAYKTCFWVVLADSLQHKLGIEMSASRLQSTILSYQVPPSLPTPACLNILKYYLVVQACLEFEREKQELVGDIGSPPHENSAEDDDPTQALASTPSILSKVQYSWTPALPPAASS
jgi:hypothetical protein